MTRSRSTCRDATRNTSTWGFPGFGVIEPCPKTSRASSRSGRPLSCWYRKNSLWTSDEAEPARMLLDAHRERSFAFDESRKEPLGTLVARESFLLIARTRHVVTTVNVRSDVTVSSSGYSGIPAFSRIL